MNKQDIVKLQLELENADHVLLVTVPRGRDETNCTFHLDNGGRAYWMLRCAEKQLDRVFFNEGGNNGTDQRTGSQAGTTGGPKATR